MADRTRDAAWISAAIEHLLTADPAVMLAESRLRCAMPPLIAT